MPNRQKIPYSIYGVLGMPIAIVALPIYIHIPKFYGELGLSIGTIGIILLCLRLLDAAQDPILGYLSDKYRHPSLGRKIYILGASPFLVLGFPAVFNPLTSTAFGHACWLIVCLIIIYSGFSVIYINYLALGAEIGRTYDDHTKIAASRACFGIAGITIALVLPETIITNSENTQSGLFWFSVAFGPILFLSLFSLKWINPPAPPPKNPSTHNQLFKNLYSPLKNKIFRKLILIFAFSGMANAIPGLLIIFYVEDILKAENLAWLFILVYFLSSGIFIPAWVKISKKIGKKKSWQLGMILSITSFYAAFYLETGDIFYFFIVCIFSGLANGSDLTLPFSILSDQIKPDPKNQNPHTNSEYFGIWQLIEKINLGLAAGLSLPLLGIFGYDPSVNPDEIQPLRFMYAVVPCSFKLLALILLKTLNTENTTLGNANASTSITEQKN